MAKPRVLVTGGSGFVGHWMRKTQPDNVTAFYFNREQYMGAWWETMGDYQYVVHLAPVQPWRVIICAKRNNARLLYCSSGIIYHPKNNTEYRQNKIAWEKSCLQSSVDCVIARLFTFYGERLSCDHAYPAFERAAKKGQPLRIWGDGSCIRSYMSGEEMGRLMWAVLLRGKSGEAYDIGSDEPVTMWELARRFSDNIIVENKRPDPMPVYLPTDTAKTRALLDDNHSSV
jgi:nucleoside-diphosphate-sugar epimerase